MTECRKSRVESFKLASLAIAIMLGLLIQSHVVRSEDQKVACLGSDSVTVETGSFPA